MGPHHAGPPQGPLHHRPPRGRLLARRAKAGEAVDARIINTSSGAGLLGSVGQAAYSAAKGGILSLTLVQAAELGRYGITANAIAPAAHADDRAGLRHDDGGA
ncbi:MAG: SDR family NAD(P)-dependent oxidoreductase [Acidimicrobiales bacterium]